MISFSTASSASAAFREQEVRGGGVTSIINVYTADVRLEWGIFFRQSRPVYEWVLFLLLVYINGVSFFLKKYMDRWNVKKVMNRYNFPYGKFLTLFSILQPNVRTPNHGKYTPGYTCIYDN